MLRELKPRSGSISAAALLASFLLACGNVTTAGSGHAGSDSPGSSGSGSDNPGSGGSGTNNPGSGGSGNAGASVASGGSGFDCQGVTVCGDGVATEVTGCDFMHAEECDGTDLRGKTCASIGYLGGKLGCNACVLDASGCQSCPAADAQLVACEPLVKLGSVVALGATDSELAALLGSNETTLFQRFAPDLSPLGMPIDLTPQLDGAFANSPDLVVTSTGWLLPVHSNASIGTLALGPTGQVISTLTVVDGDFGVDPPRLVARPSGGAFLLWLVAKDQASDLFVAVLPEGNLAHSAPLRIGTTYNGSLLATALGDGLLVAAEFGGSHALATVLVSADGASVGPLNPIAGSLGYGAGLVSTSNGGAALLYGQQETTWVKLDATGAPTSEPKVVEQVMFDFSGPVVTVGDAVIAAGSNMLATFDASGASLAAPKLFVANPQDFGRPPLLSRVQSEVVVAWNLGATDTTRGFGLARYVPPSSSVAK